MPAKPPTQSEYEESTIDGTAVVDLVHHVQSLTPNPGAGFALLSIALKEIYQQNFDGIDKSDDHLVEQFRIAIQSMRPETERLQ
jgi:hypothetical protein